jgi:hypothetical protein
MWTDRILRAVPLVLLALFVILWWQARVALSRQEDEAERRAESARLEAQGFVVAAFERERDLREAVDRLVAGNVELAGELDRARKAGLRPTGTAHLSTGSVPVAGPPPAEPAASVCLLAEGDTGRVDVDQIDLQGKAGSRVILGTASAWRVLPPPAARLFGGTFRAEVSEVTVVEEPRKRPGVGVGAWVGLSRDGWTVGPAVAAPPLGIGPLRVDVSAVAGLGSDGAWSGGIVSVARWTH